MVDEPEETGGTIDWPVAIAISVVAHVVILGLFWLLAGPDEKSVVLEGGEEPVASSVAETEPDTPSHETPSAVTPHAVATTNPRGSATGSTTAAPTRSPTRTPPPARTGTPAGSASSSARPASPATPAPSSSTASSTGSVATMNYTVKKGDFLSRIANKHGCTAAELAELNGFPKDKMLHPGDIIKVPVKH